MSSKLAEAVKLDVSGKISEAAEFYEQGILEQDCPLDTFLNLAFLYWQATDYGFNCAHDLSSSFVAFSNRRYKEVLQQGIRRFGPLATLILWQKYFAFISDDKPFDDVAKVLNRDSSLDEPEKQLFMYLETSDPKYLPLLLVLRSHLKKEETIKNRYIIGLIDSAVEFGG